MNKKLLIGLALLVASLAAQAQTVPGPKVPPPENRAKVLHTEGCGRNYILAVTEAGDSAEGHLPDLMKDDYAAAVILQAWTEADKRGVVAIIQDKRCDKKA